MSIFWERKPENIRARWWMGHAWFDFASHASICVLVPFNWPVRWLHEVWFRLRWPQGQLVSEKVEWLERQLEFYEAVQGELKYRHPMMRGAIREIELLLRRERDEREKKPDEPS